MLFRSTQSDESEEALQRRAEAWPEDLTFANLTAPRLQRITRRQGIDFATALLHDRLRCSSAHVRFVSAIDALRDTPVQFNSTRIRKIVIVPGALYLERPDLGGDGMMVREVARSLGLESDTIPVLSCGSVSDNARIVENWLKTKGTKGVVLVSLSKGGADARWAAGLPEAGIAFSNVAAWINVCGPLNGSPMADWILTSRIRTALFKLKFLIQRRDFNLVTELSHRSGSLLEPAVSAPDHIKLIHVIGFPLRRHLTTPFSRFCHRQLSAYGPNDGTTPLSDLQNWSGQIYPAWGMDHYFRPAQFARTLIAAIFRHLDNIDHS